MHPDGSAHGGSAILIKKTILHHESIHYCTNEIQATNVIIQDSFGQLLVSSVYSPPKHNLKKDTYMDFFKMLGCRFIAGGDYNAKNTTWGSRLTTTKGKELYKAIRSLELTVSSTGEPTYWPSDLNKIPDLIDFCVTKGIPKEHIHCKSCLDLSSDHSPVIITINRHFKNSRKKCQLCNSRTNWTHFQTILSSSLSVKENFLLKSETDLLESTEYLIDCIQNAAWRATPSPKSYFQKHPHCNFEVIQKIQEKRNARKLWQRTRFPEHKRQYNKIAKDLKIMLKWENEKEMNKFLRSLEPTLLTNYSLWKINRKVNSATPFRPPLRTRDNTWAKTSLEKAELFADHLQEVFSPNNAADDDTPTFITQFLEEPHQLEQPIKKFSKHEVLITILNLKDRKAPGYDCVTAEILKKLPKEGIIYITHLFNAALSRCMFPAQWKVAEIKMILKPGKSGEDVKSYRPISLLPIVSKVFEILFLKRLLPIIESRNIIPNHQFGFRRQHSTIEQVHRIVEKFQTAFEDGEYCSAIFLDISQAFDRVWHEGLLFKLKKVLPLNYYLFIRSYLSKRYFFVNSENEVS